MLTGKDFTANYISWRESFESFLRLSTVLHEKKIKDRNFNRFISRLMMTIESVLFKKR